MPILLTTPHTYDPGHGEPVVQYTHVRIHTQQTVPDKASLLLRMQYGNLSGETWTPSPEEPGAIRVQNHPRVMGWGEDPETGATGELETVAADPAYDDLRAAFALRVVDGEVAYNGVKYGNRANGFAVAEAFLYTYLIAQSFYEGTIV